MIQGKAIETLLNLMGKKSFKLHDDIRMEIIKSFNILNQEI